MYYQCYHLFQKQKFYFQLLLKKYQEDKDIEALNEVAYTAFAIYNYANDQEDDIKTDTRNIAVDVFIEYQQKAYHHEEQYDTLINNDISFLILLEGMVREEMSIEALEKECQITSLLNEIFFKTKNYQAITDFSSKMMEHIIRLGKNIDYFNHIIIIKQ